MHDVGLGTRLAFEAVQSSSRSIARAIGAIVVAVLVDQGELPLEALEGGDDPAVVGQNGRYAPSILKASNKIFANASSEPVGQPEIHDLRDLRLRIGKLARERLRADYGAVEPGCDAVFFHFAEA